MRLTRGLFRVLSLATLSLFVSSGASAAPARTGAGDPVAGGVLTGTAASLGFAALDLDELPPPAPPSPDRRIETPAARTLEPVGDIPSAPAPPPPLAPEPLPPMSPGDLVVPPMPAPPSPLAPPMQPKLPPQIAPVPEPPQPAPVPEPVPPIEPVPPPPEEPVPLAPEPPPPPPAMESVKEKIVLRGVNFDFDRAEIRGDASVILDEAVEILNRNPDRQIVIEGHTDWTGPEEYNQQLSETRAEAVKKYMVENGVEEARLSTAGFGETQPVAPNDTRDGRDRNRRVEMKVLE